MYRDKKIGLVIPAYNEKNLIGSTLDQVPPLVDRILVVDDCSPDDQNKVILEKKIGDHRIELLKHTSNQGPGGSIITGYLKASQESCDIVVVVGGDNQMPLQEITHFLDPIIDGKVDYTKGNRFLLAKVEDTLEKMPTIRIIGNLIITALTKVASGYFKVMDVVDGYTAISKTAIDTINWNNAWKKYGYPMDFLVRLNAYGFKIMDIPRTAIYLPGVRQSQIKGMKYALSVTPMLVRNFFWRLKFRYLYIDFHPLVFFYFLAFLTLPLGLGYGSYLLFDWLFLGGVSITASRAIFDALLILVGFQSLLFAMLFDMQEGK